MDFPAWDPVLIDIPGLPIDIRWYGLMYIVGFFVGQWLLVRMARAKFLPVPEAKVSDLVLWLILGVLLGGRTGYALFYDHDLLNPVQFVQVWKGGLSFHGGLAGVCLVFWLFARKHRFPVLRTGDAVAMATTPGIFFVRFANFINGELYGRVTEKGVGWAMQFPTDPVAERLLHLGQGWTMRDRELCIQFAFKKRTWEGVEPLLSQVDEHGRAIDWAAVKPHLDWQAVQATGLVPYRHPSQLYEGIGEGLVLGALLFALLWFTRRNPWRPGSYGVIFLLGYAAIRFSLEYVRQPDSVFGPSGTVLLGMTMGQTLSTGMVVGGLAVLAVVLLRRRRAAAPVERTSMSGPA
jgi:phosphatidylglycerol:prolipoprotein diacylglycerol transferase